MTANAQGSQANPIDIVTPTVGNSAQMPRPFPPNRPQADTQAMRPPTQQPQPTPQLHQPNWQNQPQQQAQQPAQQNPQLGAAGTKAKPWNAMDFRTEQLPLKEDQFWSYLGQIHLKRSEPLQPPQLEGRPVNLYLMFNLVHRNGGAARNVSNIAIWSFIGGYLGFASEPVQDGQPARASPMVAGQLRAIFERYLQPLEDLFYKKLYLERLNKGGAAPPTGATVPGNSEVIQDPADAHAKAMGYNEQQRRAFQDARQLAQSLPTGGAEAADAKPGAENKSVPNIMNNPGMVFQWIKIREDGMHTKFRELSRL